MKISDLTERLRQATDARMTDAAQRAGSEYARGVEARARARAPRRSGRLASSIKGSSTVLAQGDVRIETQAGAGLRYGRMQEFGGTVRGNPLLAVGRKPGEVGRGFFVLTAKDGRLFLARRVGTGVQLAARLKPDVRLTGRHFLRDAQDRAELKEKVAVAIKSMLAGIR